MPEHEPHVGHPRRSSSATSESLTVGSAESIIMSIRSSGRSPMRPASIGPPLTNIAGMFRRIAAMSMPGVTLSQFDMHTMASALWAFTIYSTESAIRSREGREYNMPSCPMAMPSSMAMVLNSAAKHPSFSISRFTVCPISCRWVCPGTNCVNELTMAIIGRPICSSAMPLARHSARAPAMRLPDVLAALRSGVFHSPGLVVSDIYVFGYYV